MRVPLSLVFALLLGLAACGNPADLDNFDVTIEEMTSVPGATPVEILLDSFPVVDGLANFDISNSSEFQNGQYSPDDVGSVRLKRLTMSVVSPDGQDLSFFGDVVFLLSTDGLPTIEVATASEFPEGVSSVNFDTSGADIKEYVLAKEGSFTVEVSDTKRPPQETALKITAVFEVDLGIL
ncbi:MAG: hypothetical protein CL940_09840 [Deltaproteobacteria bacterium]|nr:hypothetical protein [Deltaproteobacteria bacterium]